MTHAAPFNGDSFLAQEIRSLCQTHHVATIVETGTAQGHSTRAMATMAPRVFTVEIAFDPSPLDLGPNVTALQGNSARALPKILAQALAPFLFYLDAHGPVHSPLLDELGAIAQANAHSPIIVIHDFFNPLHQELGFDSWDIGPYTLQLITPLLERIYPDGYAFHYNSQSTGAQRGAIFIYPKQNERP